MVKKVSQKSAPCGFAAYRTLPDGTRIYAKDYGLKAFPICSTKKKSK